MRPLVIWGGLLLLGCALIGAAAPAGQKAKETAPPAGEQVFARKNCSQCHAVAAAGISWSGKDEKTHGPDLSGIVRDLDAEHLTAFLSQGGRVRGKTHWKRFWGDDADLAALVQWLVAVPPVKEAPTGKARAATQAAAHPAVTPHG